MINGFLNRVLTKMLGPSPLLNSKKPADRARARRALTRENDYGMRRAEKKLYAAKAAFDRCALEPGDVYTSCDGALRLTDAALRRRVEATLAYSSGRELLRDDVPLLYGGALYVPMLSEATLAYRRSVDALYADRARYVTYDDGSWYGDEEDLT